MQGLLANGFVARLQFALRFQPNPVDNVSGALVSAMWRVLVLLPVMSVVSEVCPFPCVKEFFRSTASSTLAPKIIEIDYLIAPRLGATDDIRNLWPEPYRARAWNAHVKDALEERLHQMVCSGQLDLSTAQHDIATDWIAAYKKYFHTMKPLPLDS